MLYVQQSLTPGEELVHVGHFHWMYTARAFMGILWGLLGCIAVIYATIYIKGHFFGGFSSPTTLGMIQEIHPGIRLGAFMVLIFGLLHFASMMVIRATTEMAVTTSRIVYKRGLVARNVGEMSIDRIEGINVLQTIGGRLLGYGRLMIRGMGVGEVVLPEMADPIAFRRAIEKARMS